MKLVMLVNQDSRVLNLLSLLLLHRRMATVKAPSPSIALNLIESVHVDLIVLDVNINDSEGDLRLCKDFRRNLATKDKPIIVLTAIKSPELTILAEQAGANIVLSKQQISTSFLSSVERLLLESDKPHSDACFA